MPTHRNDVKSRSREQMLVVKAAWKISTSAMLAPKASFSCFKKDCSLLLPKPTISLSNTSKNTSFRETSNAPQYAPKKSFSRQSAPKPNKRLASCLQPIRLVQAVVAVSPLADCSSCTASSFGFLGSLAPSVCWTLLMSASGGLLAAFSAGSGLFIAGGL
jgi:hypothetical protein